MLSKLVATKMLRMENGTISILDRTMVIMPAEVLIRFHERLSEDMGEEAAGRVMHEMGIYQTATGSQRYMARKAELRTVFQRLSTTGDPSLEMGREILKFTGMGDIKIVEMVDNGKKVVLSTANSPIALEMLKTRGKCGKPACHYVRGVMEGVLESFYKKRYSSVEKSCKATGLTDACIFEFVERP